MEHGQGAIRIFVHADRDFHIMEPVPVGRDLEIPPLRAHGVIVGDDALVLDPQHIREIRPDPGDNGRADFGGGRRKAPVVGGDEPLVEKLIGWGHVRDARVCPLLGQPIVQRAEGAR